MTERRRVVALISGRGSNLQAVIEGVRSGAAPAELVLVVSNNPAAAGLAHAAAAGIATAVMDHREYPDRESYDRALTDRIDAAAPDLVILAGFMRILGPVFVDHYEGRLMNIHPSLLPAYPGLETHARVLAAGETEHGCSVHFVTRDVDSGPIIIQARVPVHTNDTPDSLAARVLEQEHRIYPIAVRWFCEGRLSLRNGQVLLDGRARDPQELRADGVIA
ncbi:MAG: phosphoribosylglycinamide formyltransferase [Gammaproteobacteria bacterium]|nr:phosphoribosylglycinamide formyltransferase [Gammaproteobacteria bacterium]